MKKALKVTAIAFLTASMIIPAKIAMSTVKGTAKITKNTKQVADIELNSKKVYILTSYDDTVPFESFKYLFFSDAKDNYPTIATVGEETSIELLILDSDVQNYSIKIKGDNGYEVTFDKNYTKTINDEDAKINELKKNITSMSCNAFSDCADIIPCWNWTPNKVGIFNIVVYKGKDVAATRKIYVNDKDSNVKEKGYLQLGSLTTEDRDGLTKISVPLVNQRENDNNPAQIKFTVGDPLVWSRTLREDVGNNGIKLKNGNYQISAFAQGIYSVEYEDAKSVNYEKNVLNGLRLTIDNESKNGNNGNKIKFVAKVEGIDDKCLQYAFMLKDENGWTLLRDYYGYYDAKKGKIKNDDYNTYEFEPGNLSEGKHTIYVKVRLNDSNSDDIPYNSNEDIYNSYEAIASTDFIVGCDNKLFDDIEISSGELWDISKPRTAVSHEINYIHVKSCIPGLQYKAYAVHEGYMYPLCEYSSSNSIPFYPKSSGDYKLIIFAKDSPEEHPKFYSNEFDINVTDCK